MRYGQTELKADINRVNEKMAAFDSPYSFKYSSRNGYHVVDMYRDGRNLYAVATGTARDAMAGLYSTAFAQLEPRGVL